ncbi:hypothetical protein [Flaviflagellibacter deserti]|jgi:hypothetical protein|uniref:Uncharacterized protein n=1 Tax=Flaviflagellibacter deserti TaxID=2267266 RepID=A0ABV9YWC0_9HYPH
MLMRIIVLSTLAIALNFYVTGGSAPARAAKSAPVTEASVTIVP